MGGRGVLSDSGFPFLIPLTALTRWLAAVRSDFPCAQPPRHGSKLVVDFLSVKRFSERMGKSLSEYSASESHESYGLVGISRYTINPPQCFFGSSIKNHAGISLTIRRAKRTRSLAGDSYFSTDELIEIDMTASQFADMLTQPNIGDGVPCTIRHVLCKRMEKCPDENNERAKIQKDFDSHMRDIGSQLDEIIATATAMQQKTSINKADREAFVKMATLIKHQITNSLPFIHKRFTEAMDETLNEAKADLDLWLKQTANAAGIESISDKLQTTKLIE
jgi:hypothetical protein